MTDTVKKAFVKDVTINFGLLSTFGDVLPVRKPNAAKEEKFSMACPLHPDTPHGVKQRYVCEEDTDLDSFLPGECLKFKDTDTGRVLVTAEDVKAVKESELPPRVLDLQAHPYDPTSTFASGGAYVFAPANGDNTYGMLLNLLSENGTVQTDSGAQMLVGLVTLRKGSEIFVRLEKWGDQLVLRELIRPQDVDSFPEIDSSVDTKMLDLGRQLIEAQSEDFDPDAYRARVRDRIAALTDQAADGATNVEALVSKPVEDTISLLEASLAAAKAKKEA